MNDTIKTNISKKKNEKPRKVVNMLSTHFVNFLLLTKSSSKEEVPSFDSSFTSSSPKPLLDLEEC
jgi:hypothetical protein